MFLKYLDIYGFKSFADKTHVEFADGITALLGPNGCGKSNVVDAIKWVLAENRAKNLRADTMESVIFNGTDTRPPLNIAEVTLTISNENNLLPIDEPEVALKRRLYRSGESEYYINNRQVGPTEIRRLFMDTGVGKSAYSVMEQGKIDQILSSKPEDRRYLFEEAAGISRSKAECAEAERELERARQNMETIQAALSESKRNYETLKVQSEKTIKYRKIKEEIFNNELDIQLLKLKDFIQNQARQTQEKQEISEKRNQIQSEIDAILSTLTENNDKIKEFQAQLNELQQELIKIQAEKNGKSDMAKSLNLEANRIREKIGQLEVHKRAIEERIESLTEEIDEQEADLHDKTRQLEDVRKNIDTFKESIDTAANQITENAKKISESEAEIESLNDNRAEFQKQLESITEDIVTELDARLRDSGFSASASRKAKEELDVLIGKLKVFAEGRKNIFSDFSRIKGHSESENISFAEDAVSVMSEISSLVSKIEVAVSDYSKTTPSFIDEFLSPEGIITKKREIDRNISENLERIKTIRERIETFKKENANLSVKIEEYKETLSNLRVSEGQMSAQISAAKNSGELLKRNLASEQNSLRTTDEELFNETRRQDDVQEQIEDIQSVLSQIERRGSECAEKMSEIDIEIKQCSSSVSGKSELLEKKREEQRKCQAQFEQLTLNLVTNENDIKNIKQNFIETHSRDLMEFEERMYEINTSSAVLRESLSKLREEFKGLGQVNLMAPEEFAEQKERYEKLQENFDDTKNSMENLLRISEEIKSKSTEIFLTTYNQIKKNFHNMFRRLFGGGRGELKLSDPQNVLTSGIDIFAQPPGKKLENIALLSGGEKTMTAVALLFATYQVRPSPFCLLDEIDAALDDRNVTSFVQALRAFGKLSQYIVITHNKKTVMGVSTMLGVTMQESGVSKIIAMRSDVDIKTGAVIDEEDTFVDEDVEVDENAVVPPRPPKRIYNDDGTITDPVIVKHRKELKEAQRKAREEEKAAKEAEKARLAAQEQALVADSSSEEGDK
ncbi:MAG: AAA family ATPase [Treponema sp.]|nr:AAA family ATPase [Treponema sp.]